MSDRDVVTNLWTRATLDAELAHRVDEARTANSPLSLAMVDIDKFKGINDTHGHQKGDVVLAAVAARLMQVVEPKGRIYRYGGEEFLAVLPNHTVEEAIAVAERARRDLESTPSAGIAVTVSIGISTLPIHGSDSPTLIACADRALYDAKNRGRNLVRVANEPAPTEHSPRTPARKSPAAGSLTEDQASAIRQTFFVQGLARCPKDNAVLKVRKLSQVGSPTALLLAHCELCGLMAQV